MIVYRRLLAAAPLSHSAWSDSAPTCACRMPAWAGDWPGRYGHLVGVHDEPHEHAAAARAFPEKPGAM